MPDLAVKLGARRPDPHVFKRFPRLEGFVDRAVVPSCPKAWADQDPGDLRYPMDGNDTLGDCVAAWIAHQIESAQRRFATDNIVPSAEVVTWYQQESVREWGSPADQGLDPAQATLNWVKYPMGGVSADSGACTINLSDDAFNRWCAWSFRGFGLALELPDDWQTTWANPGLWEVSGAPDQENGHMLLVGGYNAENDTYLLYTWGTDKWATSAFVKTYGLYGIVPLTSEWQSIPGIDTALQNELLALGGAPVTPDEQPPSTPPAPPAP